MLSDESQAIHLKNISTRIDKYIEECNEEIKMHEKQGLENLRCWDINNVFNTILAAGQGLALTIQTVNGDSASQVAIVGGAFTFFIFIVTRIQFSFGFNALSVQHNQLADDFKELSENFSLLINDIEKNEFNEALYEQYIRRFVSIIEKGHIPKVKGYCHYFYFC